MADVETARELLVMALHDLLDGETALVERLPSVEKAAREPAFKALIADENRAGARRAARAGPRGR